MNMASKEKRGGPNKLLNEKKELDKVALHAEKSRDSSINSQSRRDTLNKSGKKEPQNETAKPSVRTRSSGHQETIVVTTPAKRGRKRKALHLSGNSSLGKNQVRNRERYATRSDSSVTLRNGKRRKLKDAFVSNSSPIEYSKRKRFHSLSREGSSDIGSGDKTLSCIDSDSSICDSPMCEENGKENVESDTDSKTDIPTNSIDEKDQTSSKGNNTKTSDPPKFGEDLGKAMTNTISALLKKGQVRTLLGKLSSQKDFPEKKPDILSKKLIDTNYNLFTRKSAPDIVKSEPFLNPLEDTKEVKKPLEIKINSNNCKLDMSLHSIKQERVIPGNITATSIKIETKKEMSPIAQQSKISCSESQTPEKTDFIVPDSKLYSTSIEIKPNIICSSVDNKGQASVSSFTTADSLGIVKLEKISEDSVKPHLVNYDYHSNALCTDGKVTKENPNFSENLSHSKLADLITEIGSEYKVAETKPLESTLSLPGIHKIKAALKECINKVVKGSLENCQVKEDREMYNSKSTKTSTISANHDIEVSACVQDVLDRVSLANDHKSSSSSVQNSPDVPEENDSLCDVSCVNPIAILSQPDVANHDISVDNGSKLEDGSVPPQSKETEISVPDLFLSLNKSDNVSPADQEASPSSERNKLDIQETVSISQEHASLVSIKTENDMETVLEDKSSLKESTDSLVKNEVIHNVQDSSMKENSQTNDKIFLSDNAADCGTHSKEQEEEVKSNCSNTTKELLDEHMSASINTCEEESHKISNNHDLEMDTDTNDIQKTDYIEAAASQIECVPPESAVPVTEGNPLAVCNAPNGDKVDTPEICEDIKVLKNPTHSSTVTQSHKDSMEGFFSDAKESVENLTEIMPKIVACISLNSDLTNPQNSVHLVDTKCEIQNNSNNEFKDESKGGISDFNMDKESSNFDNIHLTNVLKPLDLASEEIPLISDLNPEFPSDFMKFEPVEKIKEIKCELPSIVEKSSPLEECTLGNSLSFENECERLLELINSDGASSSQGLPINGKTDSDNISKESETAPLINIDVNNEDLLKSSVNIFSGNENCSASKQVKTSVSFQGDENGEDSKESSQSSSSLKETDSEDHVGDEYNSLSNKLLNVMKSSDEESYASKEDSELLDHTKEAIAESHKESISEIDNDFPKTQTVSVIEPATRKDAQKDICPTDFRFSIIVNPDTSLQSAESRENKAVIDENMSPEEQAVKESILSALGLQSLQAAKKQKSTSGTLKTVIKVRRSPEKKRSKSSLKMVLNKTEKSLRQANSDSKPKEKVEYRICKEQGGVSSGETSGDPTNFGVGSRKSVKTTTQFVYKSFEDLSTNSPFLSTQVEESIDNTPGKADDAKSTSKQASSLVIPEKSASFSIHPERLCSDVCSYCFGKFGSLDTPCHIAQLKSTERQKKILESEVHLTADSCLCDACYRHVDRKANCPSYNSSKKRQYRGIADNTCCVDGCSQPAPHQVRRKWLVKLKRSISKKVPINLEKIAPHLPFYLCEEHYFWVEYYMVCGICRRRLSRSHMYAIGSELNELNAALRSDSIPVSLSEQLFLCKLCRYYASLRVKVKDPSQLTGNQKMFFESYRKRILHYHDIQVHDTDDGMEEGNSTSSQKSKRRRTKTASTNTISRTDEDKSKDSAEERTITPTVDFGSLNKNELPMKASLEFHGEGSSNRLGGSEWEACTANLQFSKDTKRLFQELQRPYGSHSSFIRHLVLLEKYWRDGDLALSDSASSRARTYISSVKNRVQAFDGVASRLQSAPTPPAPAPPPPAFSSAPSISVIPVQRNTTLQTSQQQHSAVVATPAPAPPPPPPPPPQVPSAAASPTLPIIDLPLRRKLTVPSSIPMSQNPTPKSVPISFKPILPAIATSISSRPLTFTAASSGITLGTVTTGSTSKPIFTSLPLSSSPSLGHNSRKMVIDSNKSNKIPKILQISSDGKTYSLVPNLNHLKHVPMSTHRKQQARKQAVNVPPPTSNKCELMISDVRSLAGESPVLWNKSEIEVLPSVSTNKPNPPKLSVSIIPKTPQSNNPVTILPKPSTTIVTPTGIILSRNPGLSVVSVPPKVDGSSKS